MVKEKENQESNQKSQDSLSKAIDRLLQDVSYRRSFEVDPVGVLESMGVKVSDEQKKQVQFSSSANVDPNAAIYHNLMQQQALQAQAAQQALSGQNLVCCDAGGGYYYNPQQLQNAGVQNNGFNIQPYVYPLIRVYPTVNSTTFCPRPTVMNLENFNYGYPQLDILQQSALPQIQYASNYPYYPNSAYNFGSYYPQQVQTAIGMQSPVNMQSPGNQAAVNAQEIGMIVAPAVNVATAGTRPAVNVVTAGTRPAVNVGVNVATGGTITGEDPFADDPSLRGMAVEPPVGNMQSSASSPADNTLQQQIIACQQAQAMHLAQAAMQAKACEQLMKSQTQAQQQQAPQISREELDLGDKFSSAVDQLLSDPNLRENFDKEPMETLRHLGVVFADEARGREASRQLQESLKSSQANISGAEYPQMMNALPVPIVTSNDYPTMTPVVNSEAFSRVSEKFIQYQPYPRPIEIIPRSMPIQYVAHNPILDRIRWYSDWVKNTIWNNPGLIQTLSYQDALLNNLLMNRSLLNLPNFGQQLYWGR